MPVYRIGVAYTHYIKGQRLDKGLYVDIQSNSYANPIYNDKEKVINAFLYQRGVDIRNNGTINASCLKVKRIG